MRVGRNGTKWIYIFLGLIINLCLGTNYSWSVFRRPLEDFLGITATSSGLPYMVFLAVFSFSMPLGGYILSKVGPRLTVMIGGALVGIGWFLTSFFSNIALITITYGVVGGLGVGIAYGAPLAIAGAWFPRKRGLAIGITLIGFGLSAFITAPLASALIRNPDIGVMATFRIYGIAFFFITILLALPLRFPDAVAKPKASKAMTDSDAEIQIDTKTMLRTKQFYGLWICFIIGALVGLMAIGITSPVGEIEFLLTASAAAVATSIFSIFNGLGRPLFGAMTDKIGVKATSVLSFILIIIASVLLLVSGSDAIFLYYISFAIFWLLLGGWLAIAPTATNLLFGNDNYSKNYGFVYTAYGVGAIIGSLLSGMMKDHFDSYLNTFYPIIFLAVLGIVLSIILLKPIRRADL